ncbi:MAG: ATP-binding cassette domain-containing protein, partial [Thiothrix sp.]
MQGLYAGIDLGTSGCRLIVTDARGGIQAATRVVYPANVEQTPELWWSAAQQVLAELPDSIRASLQAIAVDGTSGTILLTDAQGNPTTPVLMYDDARAVEQSRRIATVAPRESGAHGATSSLAKLLWLLENFPNQPHAHALHQADWIAGKLAGHLGFSDENNCLKLGYDPVKREWPRWVKSLVPEHLLPGVFVPGEKIPPNPPFSKGGEETLLSIHNLNVWFPIRKGIFRRTVDHVRAVDGVSLDIPKGRIVALVGESGCGKTTLGRAVLQLEKPTSGSIQLHGQELTGLSARELRPLRPKIQIAFQDPQSSLNPRLLVETTLTEPLKAHGMGANHEERIERAARILEDMQLPRDTLWRYPHEFSGGQRQRIGLARALVLNPDFIVCDEITSALDVSV